MIPFRARASSGHSLTTMPRTKAEREAGELSKTAKSYVERWLKEQLYSRKIEFTSKYTEKGKGMEQSSLEMIRDNKLIPELGLIFGTNKDFYEDDYFTGTPDILTSEMVIDIKTSWSIDTFPLFMDSPPDNYVTQLQIYMHLTGRKKARLAYCLVSTPTELVDREVYYAIKDAGVDEGSDQAMDIEAQIRLYHDVEDIPVEVRYKSFDIEYSPETIYFLQDRVEAARKYVQSLLVNL